MDSFAISYFFFNFFPPAVADDYGRRELRQRLFNIVPSLEAGDGRGVTGCIDTDGATGTGTKIIFPET